MEYEKVTETTIGCAYRVYNKMGFGFLESVYEKCLLIELRKAGLFLNFGERKAEIKRKVKACPGVTQKSPFMVGHCPVNIAHW